MGSRLGPFMANAFMCKIKKQLEIGNKLPIFYKRFVDDTLNAIPDPETASEFLSGDIKQESSLHRFYNEVRRKWQTFLSFPLSKWMLLGMVATYRHSGL